MPNRSANLLAGETSPYLLQHAGNPVAWRPWGPEALALAREEDRPIFLSVGYSACHWCHVMERESFESEEIARLLNDYFVPIKVDREERPDIDELYMQAVQLVTGQGGWPMSVFLTPDGRPFYGGTYFPPEDRFGRPGFGSVLVQLAEAWRNRRDEIEEQASRLSGALEQGLSRPPGGTGRPDAGLLERAVRDLEGRFDPGRGGFSPAPKFPHAQALVLLLGEADRNGASNPAAMALASLDAMDRGGIHDQVGGGFHRYSTDAAWLVPHFEKMLYDQALLAGAFLEAWERTGDRRWTRPLRGACEWVLREMTDEEGGFHSSLDADSEGVEGRFYVWERGALREVLRSAGAGEEETERYLRWYGVDGPPHFEGSWILHRPRGLQAFAGEEGIPPEAWIERAGVLDRKVREARGARVPPGRDDKVLACWNGLMIGALARAGRALGEPRYVQGAERAAGFVLEEMRPEGRLLRSWREGRPSVPGFLEDHASMAAATLDLLEATGQVRWLAEAERLVDESSRLFRDPGGRGYFVSGSDAEELLVRSKAAQDGATPSGASLLCDVMLRLAERTGAPDLEEGAVGILSLHRGAMERFPGAYTTMLLAVARLARRAGGPDARPARSRPAAGDAVLEATAEAAAPVAAGCAVDLRVKVRVAEGWQVQAAGSGPESGPFEISVGPAASDWTLEEVRFPAPEGAMGGPRPEPVHQGSFEIGARLRAPSHAEPGRRDLPIVLRYQACGDGRCLPPAEEVVFLAVEVSRPG